MDSTIESVNEAFAAKYRKTDLYPIDPEQIPLMPEWEWQPLVIQGMRDQQDRDDSAHVGSAIGETLSSIYRRIVDRRSALILFRRMESKGWRMSIAHGALRIYTSDPLSIVDRQTIAAATVPAMRIYLEDIIDGCERADSVDDGNTELESAQPK